MKRSSFVLMSAVTALLVFGSSVTRAELIMPDDLIAYWPLNGDLTDSAPALQGLPGSGSDGTYTGSTIPAGFYVTKDGRQAVDMRQAIVGNNYVRTQTFLDDGPKTVVLWANSTHTAGAFWAGNQASTANRLFFGTSDSDLLPWIGGGNTSGTGTFAGTAPNDDQWHMYVLTDTGNGGTLRMYQDGHPTPIATRSYTGSTASEGGTNPFAIGQAGGSGARYARAYIDDVAVFNRELAPVEMAWIYNAGSVGAAMATPLPEARMPKFSWLLDGNANAQLGGIDGTLATATSGGDLPTFGSQNPDPPHSYPGNNQYLQLDSTRQYVDFGNDPGLQITDAMTVSLWMKTDVAPGDGGTHFLAGKYGLSGSSPDRSWSIGTLGTSGGDGRLRLMLSSDGDWNSAVAKDYRSTSSITDDQWHHIAFTFADNDVRLYLDGVELTVGAGLTKSWDGVINELHNSSLNLNIGRRSDNIGHYEGLIDELAIWNSVLAPEEIAWLYRNSVYHIPEPSTFAMLLFAVAALAWPRRRRQVR